MPRYHDFKPWYMLDHAVVSSYSPRPEPLTHAFPLRRSVFNRTSEERRNMVKISRRMRVRTFANGEVYSTLVRILGEMTLSLYSRCGECLASDRIIPEAAPLSI